MSQLKFIAYQTTYQKDCIALFNGNIEGYFSPDEIDDFREFLDTVTIHDHYYLGFLEQKLVACGGWDKQGSDYYLRWGIVDKSYHKQGLGAQLLSFRIENIKAHHGPVNIFIKTSGTAHAFFKRFGFEVNEIIPNGIDQGIDQYNMVLQTHK